jgi:hypothetical protein
LQKTEECLGLAIYFWRGMEPMCGGLDAVEGVATEFAPCCTPSVMMMAALWGKLNSQTLTAFPEGSLA